MKRYIYLLLALSLCACGTKSNTESISVYEQIDNLSMCIDDPNSTFADYEPILVNILDSLENIVLNHPDANERFYARQLPHLILEQIHRIEPDGKDDSIWDVYNQRREDILYTWYVQQVIDSTDNSPFVIMSYAAPFDEDRNTTRVGFTFSENNNPDSEPVMIITLPDVTDYVIILFSLWDDTNITKYTEYYSSKGEMTLASDSTGTSILLFGKFLQDMLKYQQMKICYYNPHINKEECKFEPSVIGYSNIPIELYQFQQQYQSAHQWLIEQ